MSKTMNLWTAAHILTTAEGVGFDVDNILGMAIDVLLGQADAKLIFAQVLQELADAVNAFGDDTIGTITTVATNNASLAITHGLLKVLLRVLKAPSSVKIPMTEYSLRWA